MRAILYIVFLSLSSVAFTQENNIMWQQSFGGLGDVRFNSSVQDDAQNIILAGSKQITTNGIKHEDILIVKLDLGGNLIWEQTYGGSGDEIAESLIISQNGEIVVCGSTNSADGIFKKNVGLHDLFVIKLDQNGAQLSANTFGGSSLDFGGDILQLDNGNFLLGGSSRSLDFDQVSNQGQFDVVLLELNDDLDLLETNSYGGWDDDLLRKMIIMPNGTLSILASSTTYTGAYSDNRGDQDVVIYRIDQNGEIEWQKSYGGSLLEQPEDMVLLDNGNLLVAASSFSSDYDILSNNGSRDGWLFEVNPQGMLAWSTTYGSSGNDDIRAIKKVQNGEYIVFGTSVIDHGSDDKNSDLWLFRINENDHLIKDQYYFGASGFEEASSLIVTETGMIVMSGNRSGKVVNALEMQTDGWVLAIKEVQDDNLNILAHPNPTSGILYLNNCPEELTIEVYSLNGAKMNLDHEYFPGARIFDLASLPQGVYLVVVESNGLSQTIRVVKQ